MAPADEEKAFLRSAVATIPRIAEIICGFPPDDRAGALETAERRFMEAALEFGCTEIAARSRVSAVMARLRRRMEDEKKLQALLHRLTEPN
jgi:DNA-directed RNA polymerase specialized sigma24 family protein